MTTCGERVNHIFPKTLYQLHETLFNKLDLLGIPYTDKQQLFNNMTILALNHCMEVGKLKITKTTTWIGKQTPVFESIWSKLMQEPIFRCPPNLLNLVSSFIHALENLTAQRKAQKNNPSN